MQLQISLKLWVNLLQLIETSIEGKQADAANRVSNGVPVIKSFPCWINQDYVDAEQKVIDEYKNVDSALYDSYFEKTGAEGNLRAGRTGRYTVNVQGTHKSSSGSCYKERL